MVFASEQGDGEGDDIEEYDNTLQDFLLLQDLMALQDAGADVVSVSRPPAFHLDEG
jgi:hypothetical protein